MGLPGPRAFATMIARRRPQLSPAAPLIVLVYFGWREDVKNYQLYSLDGLGRMLAAVEIKASNDSQAISMAREMKRNTIKCEVWRRRRLVAVLDTHDSCTLSTHCGLPIAIPGSS